MKIPIETSNKNLINTAWDEIEKNWYVIKIKRKVQIKVVVAGWYLHMNILCLVKQNGMI